MTDLSEIAAKISIRRHNEDTLRGDLAYNRIDEGGIMDGSRDCCRYEPSLDELLADDIMEPVLRSAGVDAQDVREMMVKAARRIDHRALRDD